MDLANKNIMVIGLGKSGADLAIVEQLNLHIRAKNA